MGAGLFQGGGKVAVGRRRPFAGLHVYPPGVKMGGGHYPWDLKPGSVMTNGDVGKLPDGSLAADAVLVGEKGAPPPM